MVSTIKQRHLHNEVAPVMNIVTVARTNLSLTRTQPQCILGQVALSEASIASFRKYSSQVGLPFEAIKFFSVELLDKKIVTLKIKVFRRFTSSGSNLLDSVVR